MSVTVGAGWETVRKAHASGRLVEHIEDVDAVLGEIPPGSSVHEAAQILANEAGNGGDAAELERLLGEIRKMDPTFLAGVRFGGEAKHAGFRSGKARRRDADDFDAVAAEEFERGADAILEEGGDKKTVFEKLLELANTYRVPISAAAIAFIWYAGKDSRATSWEYHRKFPDERPVFIPHSGAFTSTGYVDGYTEITSAGMLSAATLLATGFLADWGATGGKLYRAIFAETPEEPRYREEAARSRAW